MCSYSDKVIKSLEPEKIKKMIAWNKKFNALYDESDIVTLLRLSGVIDKLWEAQVILRKEIEQKTKDKLSIFGHQDDTEDSHTTIRQKDLIFSELYKSEHMRNAGPYARLKAAMDYWCALWFWPIDKVELLPSRSEFFFDMSLILEGTIASVNVSDSIKSGQLSLFPTEMEKLALDIQDTYGMNSVVDIPRLRKENPRVDLVFNIAEENRFMHWELEFADLFAEKGGFDLVIGNPPWIKSVWSEQGILSDENPLFAVKKLTAPQITQHRNEALSNETIRNVYFKEYEAMNGLLCFLNAQTNYPSLKGQQTNLFKCFLPQAWMYNRKDGVSAFIHPDGVYDDPKGGLLRKELYPRLRKHFMFANELRLFQEVDHHTQFSLNVYGKPRTPSFDSISSLYDPNTISECYENDTGTLSAGIKDEKGNWNTVGTVDRVIHIERKQLEAFAKLFDGDEDWSIAKLPALFSSELLEVLECFASVPANIEELGEAVYGTRMWDETGSQKSGITVRNVHFPENTNDMIYSGPHISVANPLFKTSRRICLLNSDYDNIDLSNINESYLQRVNYKPKCDMKRYFDLVQNTGWGTKYTDEYRLVSRSMLNQGGERTLLSAIIPPKAGHIIAISGIAFRNVDDLNIAATTFASLPFDFYIKATGKGSMLFSTSSKMPLLRNIPKEAVCRALMLNCVNTYYGDLWAKAWEPAFTYSQWSKKDSRLKSEKFTSLTSNWNHCVPLRTDFERRQALVEIDVLTAMTLHMTLEQLKSIYRIQFPVLQSYEADTWYDANGRTVFTNNRSMNNIGFSRPEWENKNAVRPIQQGDEPWDGIMKNAPAGCVFERVITDDTMPGGPVERRIQYVAPFDRCDREKDYETAWKFFEEKYGKE